MGRDKITEIIAEIANAHQGDPGAAIELAKAANTAGACAIKFQLYTADELLVKSHPRYQHFKKQAFSKGTWTDILTESKKTGCKIYCDIFGFDSLITAKEAGADGVKIHSSDLGNDPLIIQSAKYFSNVILGAGGATAREIDHSISLLRQSRPEIKPVLLHGFQSYPTALEDACLARIQWLKQVFGQYCTVGYMDHCDGESIYAMSLPAAAIAAGAAVIEKHITLDRARRGVDYYSSLNPGEFAYFVEFIRKSERSIGKNAIAFSQAETDYRQSVKKHWVAARQINAGETITQDMLAAKRIADTSLHVLPLKKILGRTAKTSIPEDTAMCRSYLNIRAWALIVARIASKRLPNKALADVAGMPCLEHLLKRISQSKLLEKQVLCTTTLTEDNVVAAVAEKMNLPVFRGANENVLERMCSAIEGEDIDMILRITADDILIDPHYLDHAIDHHCKSNSEYSALKDVPSGFDLEIFDADLIREIYSRAVDSSGTEYLTLYISDYKDHFLSSRVPVDEKDSRNFRLTLDTPEDLKVIDTVLCEMKKIGKTLTYTVSDVVSYLEKNQQLLKINNTNNGHARPPEVNTAMRWSGI